MSIEERLPEQIRKSYVRKFTLVALAVVLVVAILGGYAQTQVSAEVTSQQRDNLLTNAQLEGNTLAQWLDAQKRVVRIFSEHSGLASDNRETVELTLDSELERMPQEVAALHYLSRDDRTIIESTDDDLEGASMNATNVVWPNEFAFDTEEQVLESWVYLDDGEPSVMLASPVPGTDNALLMVIRTNRRAETFETSIEGTETTVIGSSGSVLFDRNKSNVLTPYSGAGAPAVKAAAAEQRNGTIVTDNAIVTFTPVTSGENNDWLVVKRAPTSEALAVRQQVQTNVFALIGVALGGLLLLTVMVSRGPMRSLRKLSSQATAIAEGDLDISIDDDNRTDEVGQVRAAFRNIKGYLEVVADQADALSSQNFDAAVLDEAVPGRLGDSLDRMQADLQQFITDIEDAREEAEQSRKEAQQLATSLERQAEEFGTVMARAAEGDLTQRLDGDIDNDAMGDIAKAFNEMLAELEQTVVTIEEFASDVDSSSEEISASATEVRSASEEVSQTIQEIATGAEKQNENIQQVTSEMTDLSATVEEIASSADEVASKSQRAAETGATGRTHGENAADEMTAIEQQATDAIEQVEKLAAEMERIGEVVTVIDDIAEQTNMLALNASIEASRAGEAGEGFGVVASEIKTLAAETQDATGDIESLITEIQSLTDETVADMRAMGDRVESGQETVEDATSALSTIVGQVEEANTGVQSISDATDEQAASTEEVVSMVDEVGSISEETSAQTENVAASAEEQTASITEVSENIQTLSKRASDLKSLVAAFETAGGDSRSASSETHANDD